MLWSSGSVPRALDWAALCIAAATHAAADVAYITCQTGDALSIIDLETGAETGRWPLPGKPAGVAVDASGVFTVAADSKTVRRMDPVSGSVVAEVVLDGGPMGVALDAARNRIFVSDWYAARIRVLRADDLTVELDLAVGAAPAGLAMSSDGQLLASADRDADQVSIFDAGTLDLRHRLSVGMRPFGLEHTITAGIVSRPSPPTIA